MDNNIIAEKIKSIRYKLNLSQERFAKKIGLTGKTISAYENGRCVPPLKVLDRITSTYGESFLTANSDNKNNLVNKITLIKEYLVELEKIIS
jgi:transcriptional regulator with XRE-family HTH domain